MRQRAHSNGVATTGTLRRAQGGFVLLAVLFVLLALFALTAPFLSTARNADSESHFEKDNVQLRLGLDGAARHARYQLGETHPAVDETPYYDGLDELSIDFNFPANFVDPHDPKGIGWDAEARDVAGLIDLTTAPPQVIANLLGAVGRLTQPSPAGSNELNVTNPDNFGGNNVVFVNGELIRLGEKKEDERTGAAATWSKLPAAERGLGTYKDEDGKVSTSGPLPPRTHGVGSYIFDQRVLAPTVWKTLSVTGDLQRLDSIEEMRATEAFSMSGGFSDRDLRILRRTTSTYASVGTSPAWQRPTRITAPLTADLDYSLRMRRGGGRWVTPGALVKITNGLTTELRLVTQIGGDGQVFLDRVVENDYEITETQVSVLQKRPVNVNTASAEVLIALFTNLKLRRQNHRIDEAEARALANVCIQSRPFEGMRDFVERLVLPAGGIAALPAGARVLPQEFDVGEDGDAVLDDPRDAVALYINTLNANSVMLEFATMPLCFTSNGVFDMELRANVSAASGIERTSGVRERVEMVIPQRPDLFHFFTRQRDFDELLRHGRRAPFWLTGPETTGRYDAEVTPPSRMVPHLGTLRGSMYIPGLNEPVVDADGNPVEADRVFASDSDSSFCQLDPIRVLQNSRTQGRILHFDQESRTLEGRFLPDQAVLYDSASGVTRWTTGGTGLVRPLSLSMWIKPAVGGDGTLMAMGSRTGTADRVVFGMTGGELVLRVYDGMGDHRDTAFEEVAEVRYPIASGAGTPGLPVDVWSHVDIDVRGTRPDQMGMLVNGNATGVERDGMTRLAGGLTTGAGIISVESTDGFPPECVLRIGNELIEAVVSGPTTFDCQHQIAGSAAGFGGRLARVRFDIEGTDTAAPSAFFASAVTGSYAPGTPVMHYGYSLPLTDNVPSGNSALAAPLGEFRVGRAQGDPADNTLVPVIVAGVGTQTITVGRGWDAQTVGPLKLGSADAPVEDPNGQNVMAGFNPNGGYAMLSGLRVGNVGTLPANPLSGGQVGGWEVVRYSGVQGNAINVVERGVQFQRFTDAAGQTDGNQTGGNTGSFGAANSYVFDWTLPIAISQSVAVNGNEHLPASTFCVPISLGVPGASALSYSEPGPGVSQFAQITRLDDPESSEWVRYDEIDLRASQLVRCDPGTLFAVDGILHDGVRDLQVPPIGGGGDVGGGGPSTPGGSPNTDSGAGGGDGAPDSVGALMRPSAAPLASVVSSAVAGSLWDPRRGVDPNLNFPLSRAVASTLQFRGALGTGIAAHPPGALILPAFPIVIPDLDFERGRPGARDPVFVVDGSPTALGYPLTVHRAHYPAEQVQQHSYTYPPEEGLSTGAGPSSAVPHNGFRIASTAYVAFEAPVLVPTSGGAAGGGVAGAVTDPRLRGRLVKFPSGELPRAGGPVAIGTGAGGQVDFGVANVTADEIIFGNATAFQGLGGTSPNAHTAGAPMLLSGSVSESALTLSVFSNSVKGPEQTIGSPAPILGQLPSDGGLLRIGEEVIAYQSLDIIGGTFTLAVGGRGMLGTLPQAHEITEPVHWLEHWEVSSLAGGIGPADASLPLTDTQDFPYQGTVLIGNELVHYTSIFGGALTMPRSTGDTGESGNQGPGIFRGRYGTTPGSHAAGTAVVVFPARYWDRYAQRFDGPELGYFGLHVEQPGAWWSGVTWDGEESSTGGAEIVVQQRVGDVPWDADPEVEPRLTLLEDGTFEDGLIPIGLQGDRIEWRVFARHQPGSFDPEFGLQHGWKQTPRFNHLGVSYSGPGRVLRSIDR